MAWTSAFGIRYDIALEQWESWTLSEQFEFCLANIKPSVPDIPPGQVHIPLESRNVSPLARTRDKHPEIIAFVREHPDIRQRDIAKQFGVSQATVSAASLEAGIRRGRGRPRVPFNG